MHNEYDELGFDRPARRRESSGGGWIGLLRAFQWVWFALVCMAGIISGVAVMFEPDGGPIEGVLVIIVSVFVALLSVAGGMVALGAARDMKRSADNTEEILRRLGSGEGNR